MNTAPPNETALFQDIEQLRERFPQTQELYREVCALLFFRYGVTPTANKLYQLVRKGSMSAPAEALTKFWEDLREKSRTRIEHPDLPETLKTTAGELIATLWTSAQAAAHESLAVYKTEAQALVIASKSALSMVEADRDAAYKAGGIAQQELKQTRVHVDELSKQLAVAQSANMSLTSLLKEEKDGNAGLQHQLSDTRRDFAAEVDKLRSAIELAEERSRATERRVLLDIDRERTAATRQQKELESFKAESAKTIERHRKELAMLQEQLGDARQKNGQLEGGLQAVTANRDSLANEAKRMQDQLSEAITQIALCRAQAEDWRRKSEETQQLLQESQATSLANKQVRSKRKTRTP